MLHLKFDLRGRPSVFLANGKRYYNGLNGLALYRNPPDQAVPLVLLKEALDDAEQKIQAAANYDRIQIHLRNLAIKHLVEMFKKIAGYLQLVATENDIPELLQAGVTVVPPLLKRKKALAPAAS